MIAKIRGCAFLLLLGLALAACDEKSREGPRSSEAAALSTGEHRYTTPDGNEMPYSVQGKGEPTVLLVHCWMCDRSFWSEQVPVLAARYRTIAVDLPGHGEATADRDVWTVAGYGDDLAGMIEATDLSNVVLVGHSMGGPVSLRAAALSADRVIGIVAVDTLHDAEFEFSSEQMEEYMAAFDADFVGTCGEFVQMMFPEDGVENIMERVRQSSCSAARAPIGTALMRDFGEIDMPQWMAGAGVPIRAINASSPNPTRIETNRKYADFDAVLVDDVGHYLHMTRPEQFNPLLLEAIAEIVGETR